MEEDEEEKRSDTPERNDKDDLDKKDVTTNSKEEQNPEEKEEDTAEVEGAHVEVKPCKGSRAENREDQDDRVSKKADGEGYVASSDDALLSPKRHLERQASFLYPHASSHDYVFTSQLLNCVFFSLHEVILFNHFGCLDHVYSLLIAGEAIKHFVHAMPRPLYQSSQHRNHLTSYIIDGIAWPQCPIVMFSENI